MPICDYQTHIDAVLASKFLQARAPAAGLRTGWQRTLFAHFYPLSRAFALNGLVYTAKISQRILAAPQSASLERFLCRILFISAGEFARAEEGAPDSGKFMLFDFEPANIHYALFAKIFRETDRGMAAPELNSIANAPTRRLVDNVTRRFNDDNLVNGLANYFVIEQCAPAMVASMDHYLETQDSEYFRMHRALEDNHAEHVAHLLEEHFPGEQDRRTFNSAVQSLCGAMKDFWADIDASVFA